MRMTQKPVNALLEQANKLLGRPATAWTKTDTGPIGVKANIGHMYLYAGYQTYGIAVMANEGGGVTMLIDGTTLRGCYEYLRGLIQGIVETKEMLKNA